MITPGVLILAAGSLITSTLTRLSRVVDRARFIIDKVDQAVRTDDGERVLQHTRWLKQYSMRSLVIERALQAYYIAIALFVGSTLSIALIDVLGRFLWLPSMLVVLGIFMLFLGTAALVWETSLSAAALRSEISDSHNAVFQQTEIGE